MKKVLLSAAALLVAMTMNAQVVASINADNALGLDADNGTGLTAGTALYEGEVGSLTVGADDTYKPQDVKATANNDAIAGGLQGSNNPKDADGGTPATTLVAPVSGAYFVWEAKADGYLYVIHKASSNKAYTIFEEGMAIGYTFAAVGDAESDLGAVYQFTLKGEGEYNEVKNPVEFAEREYLKATNPDVYASHITVDAEGKESWTAISKGGIGVIVFPVFKDCKYAINANGSKMTLGGIVYSETDNVTIATTDGVTIYSAGGEVTPAPAPTPSGSQVVLVVNADNELGLDADNGTGLTAGQVIAEATEGKLSIGADDTYKPQDVAAVAAGADIKGGLQGSNNPKDADGGTPSSTLVAPVSGAYFVWEAAQDGYLYVIHKASSNKAYTIFEEGTAIGYTFAAVGDAETDLGAVYQFTLKGEGEYNELKNPVEFAEREYLKATNPDVYASHITVDAEGKESWTAISKGGIGVIVFPVFKDCKYAINANGSKMTLGGVVFSENDDVDVETADGVKIYAAGGATGIQSAKVVKVTADGAVYNLAGQKVGASYKGIVIKDGKKFFQK